ncbi:MAG: peptidoglycan DD-metalloendopeptidase family protein [Pseudomonadota bacterium]
MAKTTGNRPKKSKKPKTALGKWAHGVFGRLFSKRSIIIISDHKTQHVPFTSGAQVVFVMAALGFVAWAGFSSGSYVAAQRVIDEKTQKLETFAEENARVEAEFSLLKQDLMKLAEGGKGSKTADDAKAIVQEYSAADKAAAAAPNDGDDAAAKYSVVFNRIQFLENRVKELQSNHDAMMADIRSTTGGKIKELERVIARTGVDSAPLQRAAEAKRTQDEQRKEKYGRIEGNGNALPAVTPADNQGGPFVTPAATDAQPQGGPYIPSRTSSLTGTSTTSVLKEKDTELYFNLRKLMTLNDIVAAMPLASPILGDGYRQTSGFGNRIDPFRGVIGYHAGVDLAGASGTKVHATNDGRVDFAGWKTAYGNVVDVKHEYGFATRYGHMSSILVRPGQVVKKGQVIGVQGSTGRSTGEHIHYEVQYQGHAINPGNFLKAGQDVRALD